MLCANCLQVFPPFSLSFLMERSNHGTVKPRARRSSGTAGESSSGQCAAAHGRPRAVCNPATVASVQPGRRGAVQHTGLQQTERKRAMVSAHARAHTRTAGTTGIPWMFCMFCIFCMFCMHCSTRPSAGTFQPRNSARAHQHGHIYTHARAHTHYWHNWSDAMIDCRRVNRLRTGWCCCLCFCCQSDRDCKTCREAEDRC